MTDSVSCHAAVVSRISMSCESLIYNYSQIELITNTDSEEDSGPVRLHLIIISLKPSPDMWRLGCRKFLRCQVYMAISVS